MLPMLPEPHNFMLPVCMDHMVLSLQDCMKLFLHGAWHRFAMARLHGAYIQVYKLLLVVLRLTTK